jgi:flagellin-like hook-associated protein FlgL
MAEIIFEPESRIDIDIWDVTKKDIRDTVDMLKTATKGLDEVLAVLYRLRDLAVQAAGADCPAADRMMIAREAEVLIEEIDLIVDETRYMGKPLLNGRLDIWI